jgi:hypothetical protein
MTNSLNCRICGEKADPQTKEDLCLYCENNFGSDEPEGENWDD